MYAVRHVMERDDARARRFARPARRFGSRGVAQRTVRAILWLVRRHVLLHFDPPASRARGGAARAAARRWCGDAEGGGVWG